MRFNNTTDMARRGELRENQAEDPELWEDRIENDEYELVRGTVSDGERVRYLHGIIRDRARNHRNGEGGRR